jgi:hypothetical protein
MAVIGARPATGPWFLGRGRMRPRTRPRPKQVRRGRAGRLASRVRAPADARPLVMAIVVACALAIFYLSQSTGVAARGYEIDTLAATLADRRAEQQQLIMAIGEARSPSDITRRGRHELGLVRLEADAVTFATAPDTPAN